MDDDATLEIRLEVDQEARTLTISDNGIGMSRAELMENIGTIARSGTRELREKMKEDASDKVPKELGQAQIWRSQLDRNDTHPNPTQPLLLQCACITLPAAGQVSLPHTSAV